MTQGTNPDFNPRFSKQAPDTAPGEELILTPEAVDFIVELNDLATERRDELLAARKARREAISQGTDPTFLPETAHIRADDSWKGAPLAASAPRQTPPGQSPGAPSVRKPEAGNGHAHH